jgi:hypothetical protein
MDDMYAGMRIRERGNKMRGDIGLNNFNDRLGHWDWHGACDPDVAVRNMGATFSVGIFRWIFKENPINMQRRGQVAIKKDKVICRVIGFAGNPIPVYRFANYLCEQCDKEIFPTQKTYSLLKGESR